MGEERVGEAWGRVRGGEGVEEGAGKRESWQETRCGNSRKRHNLESGKTHNYIRGACGGVSDLVSDLVSRHRSLMGPANCLQGLSCYRSRTHARI